MSSQLKVPVHAPKLMFALALLSLWFSSEGCHKPSPIEPELPERANYTLVLQAGSCCLGSDSVFVFLVRADGKNIKRLQIPYRSVSWALASPDQRGITFRAGDDEGRGYEKTLYVYDLLSNEIRRILYETNWDDYAWSPDSRRIAFTGSRELGFVIKTVDINSGSIESLTDTLAGNERWPHWSPDGQTIIFGHYLTGGDPFFNLYAFDVRERTFRYLMKSNRQISWSPNSRYFFLTGKVYSWPELELRADLSGVSPGSKEYARWFPNSNDFLMPTGAYDTGIYRVNWSSGTHRKIIEGQISPGRLTLSKDGKLIAYVVQGISDRFFVADSDGSNPRTIIVPNPGIRHIQFLGDVAW